MLEGIALVGNPEFAIVDEAYPFISKRLLTSPHPRLKAAFRYMVYGKSNSLDIDRMIDLLQVYPTPTLPLPTPTPTRSATPYLPLGIF